MTHQKISPEWLREQLKQLRGGVEAVDASRIEQVAQALASVVGQTKSDGAEHAETVAELRRLISFGGWAAQFLGELTEQSQLPTYGADGSTQPTDGIKRVSTYG